MSAESRIEAYKNKLHFYRYPDCDKETHPYWKAFFGPLCRKLKEHDRLEVDVLYKIRRFDIAVKDAYESEENISAADLLRT